MRVFISWSGHRSLQVAQALREWIPDVIQQVTTWTSAGDIGAGTRWSREVDDQLSGTDFGIVCLNRENLTAPWILFEAGALAKKVEEARLVPYLMDDMNPGDLGPPLGQFQAQRWDKQGTRQLIASLNEALQNPLPDERVGRLFEDLWPRLERELQDVDEPGSLPEVKRPPEDMIRETLDIVRGLARQLDIVRELARQFDARIGLSQAYLPTDLPESITSSSYYMEALREALQESENATTTADHLKARNRLTHARRILAQDSKEFREAEEIQQETAPAQSETKEASPEEEGRQDKGS